MSHIRAMNEFMMKDFIRHNPLDPRTAIKAVPTHVTQRPSCGWTVQRFRFQGNDGHQKVAGGGRDRWPKHETGLVAVTHYRIVPEQSRSSVPVSLKRTITLERIRALFTGEIDS